MGGFFSQNLTEDSEGVWGGMFRHGRAHQVLRDGLRRDDGSWRHELQVGVEWAHFWSKGSSIAVDMDPSEMSWQLHLSVHKLFSWFLTVSGLPTVKTEHWEGRRLGVDFYEGALRWELWKDPHSWSSTDPKWQSGSFSLADWLFGKTEIRKTVRESHRHVPIPMPEATYYADIELIRFEYRRPRAFWWKTSFSCSVDPEDGLDGRASIPVPGKRGPDGLYGMSAPARTLAEAIGATVESVMASRLKHGRSPYYVP